MEMIDSANIEVVVESVFKKAQNEKQYCSFYGDLVEKLVRLELNIKCKIILWCVDFVFSYENDSTKHKRKHLP